VAGFDAGAAPVRVRVEGLRELRAALRALGPAAGRELRDGIKDAAELVALQARRDAPRGEPGRDPHPGQLAASIRAPKGAQAAVVSRLPYAGVHEWGGTIAPRGVPIEIDRARYVGRALHDQLDAFMERLEHNIDAVAARHGFTK
jgi:phage gpG-like protein